VTRVARTGGVEGVGEGVEVEGKNKNFEEGVEEKENEKKEFVKNFFKPSLEKPAKKSFRIILVGSGRKLPG